MEVHIPPDLWDAIKCMAFSPQQWVNILAQQEEPVYAKAFMELKGELVLNLCYDTPMKRKWLRLWLHEHKHIKTNLLSLPSLISSLPTSLPNSGQAILDGYQFNADAVINWWQVVWEGQVWKDPHPTTRALEDQDPLHASMIEAALTSDRPKAEAWASVFWASGRSLLALFSLYDTQHALENLLAQTQPGREWEYWIVHKVCLGPSPTTYHTYVFEQLMSHILSYFLIQNYVEAVEVFVGSGVLPHSLTRACLTTHARKPWVCGILNGLMAPSLYHLECGHDTDGSTFHRIGGQHEGGGPHQDAWMHQVMI